MTDGWTDRRWEPYRVEAFEALFAANREPIAAYVRRRAGEDDAGGRSWRAS
jgi:hypothetical protein